MLRTIRQINKQIDGLENPTQSRRGLIIELVLVVAAVNADTHYPCLRAVFTGRNTGVKNDARVHGPCSRPGTHYPCSWAVLEKSIARQCFFRHGPCSVFMVRVHGRRYTLPVFTARKHGP